jgi:diguanylate cyclase (GGDEF)-like protein
MTETLPRILVVDDEPENLKALERTLRGYYDVTGCESAVHGLRALEANDYSVVISDQRMPGMVGTDFLAKVAEKSPLSTRIILTAYTETREILDAINRAQIYRYVTKPWDNSELLILVQQAVERYRLLHHNQRLLGELEEKNRNLLAKELELTKLNQNLEKVVEQRTAELRLANEKLSELASTDPLTKLLNRRSFFEKFSDELERSKRYKHKISVAMIDVDHFKPFNDMEGHLCGDEALRKISQIFLSGLRKTDVLSRYGGEEFLLMMPETNVAVGTEICERLRGAVENNVFQGQHGPAYLTVSIGVAGFSEQGDTPQELVKAADQALYQAKEFGRNRVVR